MKNADIHYKHWLIKAPLGVATIGFGACLVSEAAMWKYGGATTIEWGIFGTLALVVLNTGVCLVGDAVKHRVHYEQSQNDKFI